MYKLKIIEHRIKQEVNTRKNDKHIQNLKNRREKNINKIYSSQKKIKST